MSLIKMLPDPLREQLSTLPNPEMFIIQTLENALAQYKKNIAATRTIRGKYKSLPTGSEAFSRRKRSEIDLER